MNRVLKILSFLFIHSSAFCQIIYYDENESVDFSILENLSKEAFIIKDSLKVAGLTAETFEIFEIEDKLWMTIDGRLDVYEWKNKEWSNLYKGTLHGYNHKSQKFIFNNKLYSYRGYGFWRQHGEIIEFLPEKGEWEIIPASRSIPFGFGYLMDSVYFIHSEGCYEVNPVKQTVNNVSCLYSLNGEIPHGKVYNFDNYILVAGVLKNGEQFPLVEKENGKVYLSRRNPFSALREKKINNSIIYIRGDEMKITFPDSDTIQYAIADELQYYNELPFTVLKRRKWTSAGIILIVIIGAIILFRSARSPAKKDSPELAQINAFKDVRGELINSDKLDEILEIDMISIYESRKHKRSALIREINALSKAYYKKSLILRVKDPKDKRFYLYRIQSF